MKANVSVLKEEYDSTVKVFRKLYTDLREGKLQVSVNGEPLTLREFLSLSLDLERTGSYREMARQMLDFVKAYNDKLVNETDSFLQTAVRLDSQQSQILGMVERAQPVVDKFEDFLDKNDGRTPYEVIAMLEGSLRAYEKDNTNLKEVRELIKTMNEGQVLVKSLPVFQQQKPVQMPVPLGVSVQPEQPVAELPQGATVLEQEQAKPALDVTRETKEFQMFWKDLTALFLGRVSDWRRGKRGKRPSAGETAQLMLNFNVNSIYRAMSPETKAEYSSKVKVYERDLYLKYMPEKYMSKEELKAQNEIVQTQASSDEQVQDSAGGSG